MTTLLGTKRGMTQIWREDGTRLPVTVLDMEKLEPVLAYSNGKRIMENGEVFPMPSRFITTSEGVAAVKAAGMEALVLEPGTWLPARD